MGRRVNVVVEYECDICGHSAIWGGGVDLAVSFPEPPHGWERPESALEWWCHECMTAWQEASDEAKERVKEERCGLNRGRRGD